MILAKRRIDLDCWKGIAIIAVLLYHLSIVKTGYLGVDLFLVINGFLIIPSVMKQIQEGTFSYVTFLRKRILRLAPLILIASALSLAVGYSGMLPDDYENLSQTAVASNVFSQNILASITTRDYWKSSNAFSPLMHMWYVGILVEFYFIFPLIALGLRKVKTRLSDASINIFLVALTLFSIIIFINPNVPIGNRFYLLPYRLYEFTLGGLIGFNSIFIKGKLDKIPGLNLLHAATALLLLALLGSSLFFINQDPLGLRLTIIGVYGIEPLSSETTRNLLILSTSLLSAIVISRNVSGKPLLNTSIVSNTIALLGRASFSIFVWHQILIAFYRYFISPELTLGFLVYFALSLALLSAVSYRYVEQAIKPDNRSLLGCIMADIAITAVALLIYLHAGVMRDVPELDVSKDNVQRNMFALYCDRVYQLDQDFPINGKPNVLIVNASFARDFANVLLESSYKDSVNISYSFEWDELLKERISQSDFIFAFGFKQEIPAYVFENMKPSAKIWGIGTKNFGFTSGNVYARRNEPDYFQSAIPLREELRQANDSLRQSWGENYIDFVQLSLNGEGNISLFTPEHKLISQDCNHLTQNGAKHFAALVPWNDIFH